MRRRGCCDRGNAGGRAGRKSPQAAARAGISPEKTRSGSAAGRKTAHQAVASPASPNLPTQELGLGVRMTAPFLKLELARRIELGEAQAAVQAAETLARLRPGSGGAVEGIAGGFA